MLFAVQYAVKDQLIIMDILKPKERDYKFFTSGTLESIFKMFGGNCGACRKCGNSVDDIEKKTKELFLIYSLEDKMKAFELLEMLTSKVIIQVQTLKQMVEFTDRNQIVCEPCREPLKRTKSVSRARGHLEERTVSKIPPPELTKKADPMLVSEGKMPKEIVALSPEAEKTSTEDLEVIDSLSRSTDEQQTVSKPELHSMEEPAVEQASFVQPEEERPTVPEHRLIIKSNSAELVSFEQKRLDTEENEKTTEDLLGSPDSLIENRKSNITPPKGNKLKSVNINVEPSPTETSRPRTEIFYRIKAMMQEEVKQLRVRLNLPEQAVPAMSEEQLSVQTPSPDRMDSSSEASDKVKEVKIDKQVKKNGELEISSEAPKKMKDVSNDKQIEENVKRILESITDLDPNYAQQCTICDVILKVKVPCSMRKSIGTHVRGHINFRPYSCKNCDYVCRYNGRMADHMKFKHPNDRTQFIDNSRDVKYLEDCRKMAKKCFPSYDYKNEKPQKRTILI